MADIGPEGSLADRMYLFVAIAMTCQLVTLGDDTADQGRMSLCHPAEGEEGRPYAGGCEEVEHTVRVRLHASFTRGPSCRAG